MLFSALPLFSLFLHHASCSPIMSIVYKKQFPPLLVSASVIISEKYALTTTNPVCAHPRDIICGITDVRLSQISRYFYETHCYDVKEMHFPPGVRPVELVVIEFKDEILFDYGVNPASFPLEPPSLFAGKVVGKGEGNRKKYQYTPNNCQELLLLRDSRNLTAHYVRDFYLSQIQTMLTDMDQEKDYFDVYHDRTSMIHCTNYNGMPLICDYEVYGMLLYRTTRCKETHGFLKSCLFDCEQVINAEFVNMFHKNAQTFIRRFIRGAKTYEESLKMKKPGVL